MYVWGYVIVLLFTVGFSPYMDIDGHDKLTPYGLMIHGCIDGYRRVSLSHVYINLDFHGKYLAETCSL